MRVVWAVIFIALTWSNQFLLHVVLGTILGIRQEPLPRGTRASCVPRNRSSCALLTSAPREEIYLLLTKLHGYQQFGSLNFRIAGL